MTFQMLMISAFTICLADTPRVTNLKNLSADVQVSFDAYDIPHIFADSWTDAACVLGYLHASHRLIQMDLYRRQASGTMAEIMGPDAFESDKLVRQLGLRRTTEAFWNSDDVPAPLRAEILAYCDGVNQRLAELTKTGLPPFFAAMGYAPQPWSPIDALVFSKYMGWDQSGTMDDLWFGIMVEKFGIAAATELWPLERPYEIPIVAVQADRAKHVQTIAPAIRGNAEVYSRLIDHFAAVRRGGPRDFCGSNNWAVGGTRTRSGKPILCNDPHLGFSLPSFWYTVAISVNEEQLAGVGFPGSPIVVIGHTDHHGWGITNMQADAVDFFVETLDPKDPSKYRHRGELKNLQRIVEMVPVRGEAPRELVIESTVHGPIINRDGQTISLAWTGLGVTGDAAALWGVSRAKTLAEFLKAADKLKVPAINLVYADASGNIAIHPCGELPIRTPGQGRIPMDGASGENDWQGMIPRDRLTLAINPASDYVASANNRPTPPGFPFYVGWMWDPSYRARRIQTMLAQAKDLTVESMRAIQNDVYDEAASRFVPVLLANVKETDISDPTERQCLRVLADWDFIADIDSKAPIVWQRWFEAYRDAVWQDEWETRQIPKQGGSWGFSGNNRREPMLEILEFMTREDPDSHWFDDRRTKTVETRNDIFEVSLANASARIAREFGSDPDRWTWGDLQHLGIRSLTGQPDLARTGGPVPGTDFTVNPGGEGGNLGGGACWRMIVDFGKPAQSLGVYPGGQSEDPESPHYADQMPLWEAGKYTPLHLVPTIDKLPKAAQNRTVVFTSVN